MIPASFEYSRPETLKEAIALSESLGEQAKYLSGGHSLIPMMKLRFAEPAHLIDIGRIPGFRYIREEGDELKIGGLTTESDLEHSELIRESYPILLDAAKMIADPSVRNKATVGGNLAHGDPANDHPAVMLALGASVVVCGPDGERVIPIDDFFQGFYATALDDHDILTEIRIPKAKPNSGGSYLKVERKVGDYATSGAAVFLGLEGGRIASAGIGLTNVAPEPLRLKRAEELIAGAEPSEDLIDRAGRIAAEDCQPSADLRGGKDYKRAVTRHLTSRAIRNALERASSS